MSRAPLQVRFDVAAPVADVHRFVIAKYFDNHVRWDRGLLELVAVGDREVRAGVRGRETRRFLGRQETEFEIVEVTDRRLRLRDQPAAWTLERIYDLAPNERGTSVTFTFAMEPNSGLFRLAYPIARFVIAAQVRRNMGVLAGLLGTLGPDAATAPGSSPSARGQR